MVGLHSFCSTLRAIKDFWIISSAQLIYHSFRYQILLLFCLRLASFSNTTQRLWLLTRLVMMMKSTVKLIVLVAMREFKHISSPVAPIIGTLIICSSISPSSSPFDKCGEMVALSLCCWPRCYLTEEKSSSSFCLAHKFWTLIGLFCVIIIIIILSIPMSYNYPCFRFIPNLGSSFLFSLAYLLIPMMNDWMEKEWWSFNEFAWRPSLRSYVTTSESRNTRPLNRER